jgi:hypothetical protein
MQLSTFKLRAQLDLGAVREGGANVPARPALHGCEAGFIADAQIGDKVVTLIIGPASVQYKGVN